MLQNNNVHTKVDSYTADSCYNSQKNGLAFTKKKKNDQKFASPSAVIQVPKGSFLGEPLDANGSGHPRQANFFCARGRSSLPPVSFTWQFYIRKNYSSIQPEFLEGRVSSNTDIRRWQPRR